jgi:hypothetical protein
MGGFPRQRRKRSFTPSKPALAENLPWHLAGRLLNKIGARVLPAKSRVGRTVPGFVFPRDGQNATTLAAVVVHMQAMCRGANRAEMIDAFARISHDSQRNSPESRLWLGVVGTRWFNSMNVTGLDLWFAQGSSSSSSGSSGESLSGRSCRSHNLDPKLSIFLPMAN